MIFATVAELLSHRLKQSCVVFTALWVEMWNITKVWSNFKANDMISRKGSKFWFSISQTFASSKIFYSTLWVWGFLFGWFCFSYLLEVGVYLEHEFPSQAQYGSLARQQSAQAFPYVWHLCRESWTNPSLEPMYNCCCKSGKANELGVLSEQPIKKVPFFSATLADFQPCSRFYKTRENSSFNIKCFSGCSVSWLLSAHPWKHVREGKGLQSWKDTSIQHL